MPLETSQPCCSWVWNLSLDLQISFCEILLNWIVVKSYLGVLQVPIIPEFELPSCNGEIQYFSGNWWYSWVYSACVTGLIPT